MKKEDLINSAKKLKQPGPEVTKEYSGKMNQLVTLINTEMLNRPDIKEMVGETNLEMMQDNHANHARFMESVFLNYEPEVLVNTVLWVFRAYRSRDFRSIYWAAQINTWIKLYEKELSAEAYSEILPFYKWMQVNIPVFNTLAEQDIDIPLASH